MKDIYPTALPRILYAQSSGAQLFRTFFMVYGWREKQARTEGNKEKNGLTIKVLHCTEHTLG